LSPLDIAIPNPALGDEWFNADVSGGGKREKRTALHQEIP